MIAARPVPLPRKRSPALIGVASTSQKPKPPPKPAKLRFEGVKFRKEYENLPVKAKNDKPDPCGSSSGRASSPTHPQSTTPLTVKTEAPLPVLSAHTQPQSTAHSVSVGGLVPLDSDTPAVELGGDDVGNARSANDVLPEISTTSPQTENRCPNTETLQVDASAEASNHNTEMPVGADAQGGRRAVAQVPPQSGGQRARPQPVPRNASSHTPLRLQDYVPLEHTDSPIVQILAAAAEVPGPSRAIDALTRSLITEPVNATMRALEPLSRSCVGGTQGISPGASSNSSGISSASDLHSSIGIQTASRVREVPIRRTAVATRPRMGVSATPALSLLEQIIRSHPVWYLPHLGRAAANHLLRPMPCGSFVVRASTRPMSMALSVRLSALHVADTDHYLLERIGSAVRLEGSPVSFRSLPLLLEHYCRTADELQCMLTLPAAVTRCGTATELQRVALMGQEFWTSDLAMRDARPFRRQHSQPVLTVSKSSTAISTLRQPQHSQQTQNLHNHQIIAPARTVDPAPSRMKERKCVPSSDQMLMRKSHSESVHLPARASEPSSSTSCSSSNPSTTDSVHGKQSRPFLRGLFSGPGVSGTSTTAVHGTATDTNSTAASLRRSFARIRNLKPGKSKDDAACMQDSLDAIRARQAAFRRERSDISAASVLRLAAHRRADGSPTRVPTHTRQPLLPSPGATETEGMQRCIEELRQKRMAAECSNAANVNANGHDPAEIFRRFGGFLQNNGKPYEFIMRNKKSSPKMSQRMSVPSFGEPELPATETSVLSTRFGRVPETGELHTINEGLVTPVARRKQYFESTTTNHDQRNVSNRRFGGIEADGYTSPEYLQDNRALGRAETKARTQRNGSLQPTTKPSPPVRSLYAAIGPSRTSRHGSTPAEARTRQRVATVRPTPQAVSTAMAEPVSASVVHTASKVSEYSLLTDLDGAGSSSVPDDDCVSVAGTVFNEPWDSNAWENLLDLAKYGDEKPTVTCDFEENNNDDIVVSCVDSDSEESLPEPMVESTDEGSPGLLAVDRGWAEVSQRIPSEPGSKASTFDPRRPPRSRSANRPQPGARIQTYVENLAKDSKTVFGATLRRFIECTVEAEECDPHVVIRNVRQFLNGIKNYLVKHGEGDLHELIECESGLLSPTEFLNIDAILEAALHKILLVPVKSHLYHLMVRDLSRTGALQRLSENLLHVRSLPPSELGLPPNTQLPEARVMEQVKQSLRRMQSHYSPLKKLEHLLRALSLVLGPERPDRRLPPAAELVRWLVFLLAKTSAINCEVEAWYMWELLPPTLLTTGDAAFHLTTLFSAVHVLKHPDALRRLGHAETPGPAGDAFLSVAVPDEQSGSIEYHTFPAVPQMNAAKMSRVIAHQCAITNPEDYGLYVLCDGFESCLLPTECPDTLRAQLAGKSHLFAYKRHEAKIAWPKLVVGASRDGGDSALSFRPLHSVQPSPVPSRKLPSSPSRIREELRL